MLPHGEAHHRLYRSSMVCKAVKLAMHYNARNAAYLSFRESLRFCDTSACGLAGTVVIQSHVRVQHHVKQADHQTRSGSLSRLQRRRLALVFSSSLGDGPLKARRQLLVVGLQTVAL